MNKKSMIIAGIGFGIIIIALILWRQIYLSHQVKSSKGI